MAKTLIDFDTPIDRSGTHAEKYEARKRLFGTEEVEPLWVADMEFGTPQEVIDALKERLSHPILGYTQQYDALLQAIRGWMVRRHGVVLEEGELLISPSVVASIIIALYAFTQEGEAVLIQPPIYPPFYSTLKHHHRTVVEAPLRFEKDQFVIDFEAFERLIVAHRVKLFLFSNPHNPTGRVFTQSELQTMAAICQKHGVIIFSDEIHSDLVHAPHKHLSMVLFLPELTVLAHSPSKTFNLAGMKSSFVAIKNKKLYMAFAKSARNFHLAEANVLGMVAMQTAFEKGDQYADALVEYLNANRTIVVDCFNMKINSTHVVPPQATYLAWIDFRSTRLPHEAVVGKLIHEAKAGLNDGRTFGLGGEGFMRLNFALPKARLEKALDHIKKVFT